MATFNPNQSTNRPAQMPDVKLWVASSMRRIRSVEQARRRLREASRATAKCLRTPGCDPQHHISLATTIRQMYFGG